MQRSALFTIVLAASAVTASAADLSTAPPPAEPGVTYAPSPFNWTGVYAGIHGGFGGDRFEYPFFIEEDAIIINSTDVTGQADITSSGFFGGGQIGANWQFSPQMVVGVEADAAWSGIKGELGIDVDPCCGGFDGIDIEAGSKVNWFGTVRGRLGFLPTSRLMVYGTGGVAYGETESYATGSGEIDFDVSTSDTGWGWAAGAGFEYAVTNNITFKTEYLYVDLGSQELLNLGPDLATLDVDTHFHTIKAGLNFLYGQSGGAGADLAMDVPATSGPFNWTGVYVGAHGGYGGDRFDYPFFLAEDAIFGFFPPDDVTGQFDLTSSGFFGGGQVGANWQFSPQMVVGVEADASWSDIQGELGIEVDPCCGGFPGASIEAGSKVNWFGTIRGRLGFLPTDRLMVYGTGGAAYGEVESFATGGGVLSGLDVSTAETNWGWTAGGGFEYALTDNVTLKTEYLYVDLGSQELLNLGGGAFTLDADAHFHSIKAGLNVLFN